MAIKKELLIIVLLILSLSICSCKKEDISSENVVYKGKVYQHIENWKPIETEFDEAKAYLGEINSNKKEEGKRVYVFRNCDEKFLFVKGDIKKYYYHLMDDILPSYKDVETISKIKLSSPRGESVISPELSSAFIEHIVKTKENSYISYKNKIISEVIVEYKNYPATQTIGHIVYDDEGTICFSDISLPEPDEVIWVYPIPPEFL